MPNYKFLFLILFISLLAAGCNLVSESANELQLDNVEKVSSASVSTREPSNSSAPLSSDNEDIANAVLKRFYEASETAQKEIKNQLERVGERVDTGRWDFEDQQYDFNHVHVDTCNCRIQSGIYTLNGSEKTEDGDVYRKYLQGSWERLDIQTLPVFDRSANDIIVLNNVIIDSVSHVNTVQRMRDGGSSGILSESTVVKFISDQYYGTIVIDEAYGSYSSSVLSYGNSLSGDPDGDIEVFHDGNTDSVLSVPYKDLLNSRTILIDSESLTGEWIQMDIAMDEIIRTTELEIVQNGNQITVYENNDTLFTGTVSETEITCNGWGDYGFNPTDTFTVNRYVSDILYLVPVVETPSFIVMVRQ